MGRTTISIEDFWTLRSGDLVVWRGKYLRTVAKGPADATEPLHHPAVEFPIRRRSWTQRIATTYNYSDVKDKIALAGKRTRGLMLPSEWRTLETVGFNVREELTRELDEKTEAAERTHGPLCKAYGRLVKLIRKEVR